MAKTKIVKIYVFNCACGQSGTFSKLYRKCYM